MELKDLVKLELPHIKKVINELHSQGLSSGALPQIYGTLFGAVYGNNTDALLRKHSSRAVGTCAHSKGCWWYDPPPA